MREFTWKSLGVIGKIGVLICALALSQGLFCCFKFFFFYFVSSFGPLGFDLNIDMNGIRFYNFVLEPCRGLLSGRWQITQAILGAQMAP